MKKLRNLQLIDPKCRGPNYFGISWPPTWGVKAQEEGWGLFEVDRFPGIEIECDDEAGIFESDDEAIAHVIKRTEEGSYFHWTALTIAAVAEYLARVDGDHK